MDNGFFCAISKAVSQARLIPDGAGSLPDETVLGRYLWNTALSESLYPILNGLEVALRNSLHDAISTRQSNEYWFDSLLLGSGSDQLEEVRSRSPDNESPSSGQVVAGLSFGFWTHLFNSCYEGVLWPDLLESVFPNIPGHLRKRRVLSRNLNKIRRLRNRISHHEPIWSHSDLPTTHQQMMEVIGWISPEKQSLVQLIDRFPAVHSQGVEHYRRLILAI